LPHDVRDRLALALAPFRNREAAYALATFIARFWSIPGRVAGSFPIDRRALADHEGLELTEARVRGAIRTLEAVGYLERALSPSGSRYKATEYGLHRKPILFVFGAEYGSAFVLANKRAQVARGGNQHGRRSITPAASLRPSGAFLGAHRINSPKSRIQAEPKVIMGEVRKETGFLPELTASTPLESALARFREGVFGKPRLG
jgi:hypothetical protein